MLKLSARAGPGEQDLGGHRRRIVRELMKTAVLVDRSGCESMHRTGTVPEEHRGLCRRRTLDLAWRPELWELLEEDERQLLISEEGSWSWEQTWPRVLRGEDVRVMRWVIGVDEVLVPFEFLEPDLTPTLLTTTQPGRLEGQLCLASYDLRPAQSVAREMVARCLMEGVKRGFYEVDAEEAARCKEAAESFEEGEDLLLGSVSVGKAASEKIQWVAQAAVRRETVLTSLIDYLNAPAEGWMGLQGSLPPLE